VTGVRRAVAVVAAVISISFGISGALRPDQRRAPVWAERVQAVTDAPIPTGSRVGLLAPPGLGEEGRDRLLFECAWQRPDLLWSAVADGEVGANLRALVVFGPAVAPNGWERVWSGGELAVLTRVGP